MNKVIIIAEAGVNHNGSLDMALQLIDAAAESGADYVKFQTFNTNKLVSKYASKAEYQLKNTANQSEDQISMLKALELSEKDHFSLIERTKEKGIGFLSTAFDLESIEILKKFNMPFWKIPSGEITNYPYLRAIASTGKPVIISTGMADMNEIEEALEVLRKFGVPKDSITLLHCTTEYPAPKNQINLRGMLAIEERFNLPVGYSDHTEGIEIPIAATAMGACVIEKHFTLNKSLPGPDHRASLDPSELKEMVQAIRAVESALGNKTKIPANVEKKNMAAARKSIVAATKINKGETFLENNITTKRPGNGISPMKWESVIGQVATKDYNPDDMIVL